MTEVRNIRKVFKSTPTLEGAGVHLKRVFGFSEVPLFDPFLLLDDFGSDNPDHYLKGFPWHPHRGIETITFVLNGNVEHGDSLGNKGYFCKEANSFTYEVEERNSVDFQRDPFLSSDTVVLFDDGDEIVVFTETHSVRFLLISGKPIGEPVAWYGPIVMNTNEELQTALEEYKQGTFLK